MTASAADGRVRRMAALPDLAEPRVREAVATIARDLREQEATIVADMSDTLAREIDHLDDDPALVDLLHASVHGNVSTILHILTNDIPVEHLQPTTAAVEYALRLAQRDVPSNSLVRAYHMGQNVLMRMLVADIERLALPAETTVAVLRHASDVVYAYIDWITLYVFDAYENERRRWVDAHGGVLSARIHHLLSTPHADVAAFEQDTGYRVSRSHLAAIVWVTDERERDLRGLDRIVGELARAFNAAGAPLATAIDRTTMWAWIPIDDRKMAVDVGAVARGIALPGGVRIALGRPASGTEGFRRSHEQARAAYEVATRPAEAVDTVTAFSDRGVAVVALLAHDIAATRAWVREVLGGLAQDSPNAATLRETLGIYLATKESHLHTAEKLSLHRNTVKYRVDKAMGEAGTRDRLDLALALTVVDYLGAEIITA